MPVEFTRAELRLLLNLLAKEEATAIKRSLEKTPGQFGPVLENARHNRLERAQNLTRKLQKMLSELEEGE